MGVGPVVQAALLPVVRKRRALPLTPERSKASSATPSPFPPISKPAQRIPQLTYVATTTAGASQSITGPPYKATSDPTLAANILPAFHYIPQSFAENDHRDKKIETKTHFPVPGRKVT